jgi:ABC-type polysaccharide/polyol phosphate transport system ATPase subunit
MALDPDIAIEVRDVVKDFRIYERRYANLKGTATALIHALATGKRIDHYFMRRALDHVSLRVRKGEAVAIVGHNGSGKSTLLSILSRIYLPTSGEVEYRGRLMSLLELGAGFHQELTGSENVLFAAAIQGVPREKALELYPNVVRFSELNEEAMGMPLRMFSSGMVMRLAFSTMVHMDADILLVDEALAVGDEAYQEKCFATMGDFRSRGKTVMLVSHELDHVERFADRVVWLEAGRILAEGDVAPILGDYRRTMHSLLPQSS